jgi:hypothetical protein
MGYIVLSSSLSTPNINLVLFDSKNYLPFNKIGKNTKIVHINWLKDCIAQKTDNLPYGNYEIKGRERKKLRLKHERKKVIKSQDSDRILNVITPHVKHIKEIVSPENELYYSSPITLKTEIDLPVNFHRHLFGSVSVLDEMDTTITQTPQYRKRVKTSMENQLEVWKKTKLQLDQYIYSLTKNKRKRVCDPFGENPKPKRRKINGEL